MTLDKTQSDADNAEATRLAASRRFADEQNTAPITRSDVETPASRAGAASPPPKQTFWGWVEGNVEYLAQTGAGAAEYGYNQITSHPWETAGMVGIGVAAIAAAPIAGALGASAAVVAGIDAAVTTGGLAFGGYTTVSGVSELAGASTGEGPNNAYTILTNPEGHSEAELEDARRRVRENMGPGVLDATLGAAGLAGTAVAGTRLIGSLGKATSKVPDVTPPKPPVPPPQGSPTPPLKLAGQPVGKAPTPEITNPTGGTTNGGTVNNPDTPVQNGAQAGTDKLAQANGDNSNPHADKAEHSQPAPEAKPVQNFRDPVLTDPSVAEGFTKQFKDMFSDWDKEHPNSDITRAAEENNAQLKALEDKFISAVVAKTNLEPGMVQVRVMAGSERGILPILKDDPDLLRQYEEFKREAASLKEQGEQLHDARFEKRNQQLRDTIDTYCKDHSLPTPEVRFDPIEPEEGGYNAGRIAISEQSTLEPNGDLVKVVGHELTHLEQDALTIRYLAQKLDIRSTGSDADIARLTAEYSTELKGRTVPDAFARRALEAARDQTLSPDEVSRAEKVISAFNDYKQPPNEAGRVGWMAMRIFSTDEKASGYMLATTLNQLAPEVLGKTDSEVASVLAKASQIRSGGDIAGWDDARAKTLLQQFIGQRFIEEGNNTAGAMNAYKDNFVEREAQAAENAIKNSMRALLPNLMPNGGFAYPMGNWSPEQTGFTGGDDGLTIAITPESLHGKPKP